MRNRIALCLCALLTFALTACGGDDSNPMQNTPAESTMTAVLDDVAWTAVAIAPVRTGGIVAIGASDTTPIGIGIGFPDTGTGTYPIEPGQITNANVNDNRVASLWQATSAQGNGTITVETLTDTGTSGTFNFTAPLSVGSGPPATRVVTEGRFDVKF